MLFGHCCSTVQNPLMGTSLYLPGGDFRWCQEQVLQAACLQIKCGFSSRLPVLCDALIFMGQSHRWAWAREMNHQLGVGMVAADEEAADCMFQPGKIKWRGEPLHPSVLPLEPQTLSLGWRCCSSHLKINGDEPSPKAGRSQGFASWWFLAPAGPSSWSLVVRHCSGTYSWDSSECSEPILWLPLVSIGGFRSCEVASAAGTCPWVGIKQPRLQVFEALVAPKS